MSQEFDVLIDATMDECPIPTIRMKEALDAMSDGKILKLVTSSEGTIRNIRTFTSGNNSCQLLNMSKSEEGFVFLVQKHDAGNTNFADEGNG